MIQDCGATCDYKVPKNRWKTTCLQLLKLIHKRIFHKYHNISNITIEPIILYASKCHNLDIICNERTSTYITIQSKKYFHEHSIQLFIYIYIRK